MRNIKIFIAWIAFICLEQKPNLNFITKYVKIKVLWCCNTIPFEDTKILEFN